MMEDRTSVDTVTNIFQIFTKDMSQQIPPFPYHPPDPPNSNSPTFQYMQFFPSDGGPLKFGAFPNQTFLTLDEILLTFVCDPAFPQFVPSTFTLACRVIGGSELGRPYHSQGAAIPLVHLDIWNSSGYPLVPQIYLSQFTLPPYDQTYSWGPFPFDFTLWGQIDHCTIEVGNHPAAFLTYS